MAYRILIVDDSSTIRRMLKKAISMAGLGDSTVIEAADGREALTALKNEWIDVVFSDLHMPNMDGEELVKAMAGDSMLAEIPVVIVSSDRSEARLARLRECGVKECISKPFRPESFREVIQKLLEMEGERNVG